MNSRFRLGTPPSGMFGLTIILVGQAVSILASSMTSFALSIYVFQQTSSATSLGLMQTAFTLPYLLIIPLAGVMVDRYNRKLMMMISDLTAGLATILILILLTTGSLQIWYFYLLNGIIGLGNAFQWPAYSAAISTMVPKEQYGRANGMVSFVQAGPGVVAPLLAGAIIPFIGLKGILLIDILTFVLAIGILFCVSIPQPARTADGEAGKGNLLQEASFGFKYIFARSSLLAYVILLFLANLFLGFANSVQVPLVLLRSDNSSLILGAVETAGAISWTVGSIVMGVWGGPKRRMIGAIFGWIVFCLFGNLIFALGKGLTVWIPAILIAGFGSNVGTATSQAILQAKVAPDVQGRVFSARRLLTWFPEIFTPTLGGLLADRVVEPAMGSETWLSNLFGWMVGKTPGSGMAIIMFGFGLMTIITMFTGYLVPRIRNIEDILPDHDQMVKANG